MSLRTLAREFYFPNVLKHKTAGMSIYENKDSRKVLKDRLRRFVKKKGFQTLFKLQVGNQFETRKAKKWRKISFYS